MTKTHVLFVTDKSGSMVTLATDVCGGFNAMITNLKTNPEPNVEFAVTVTLFDSQQFPLCEGVTLDEVPELTDKNYRIGGSTALLDAIGDTVSRFKESHPELGDDKVMLVIQTDGEENSSYRYRISQIKDLIDKVKNEGWAVLYLGQSLDAWQQGRGLVGQSTHVVADPYGTRVSYEAVTKTARRYAGGQVANTDTADFFEKEYLKKEDERK